MKKDREGERLELRLLKMPFEQMLSALVAIDDLDLHLLGMIETEVAPEDFQRFQNKLVARREARRQLIELRIQLEAGTSWTGFAAKNGSSLSVH